MKKSLLFVAALLLSAMTFADIVVFPGNDEVKTVQSSYNNEEKTFTLSEIEFGFLGAQYNANESPKVGETEKAAKKQFIQLRKFVEEGNPAGQLYNKTAVAMKSVIVLQQNEKNFKFSAGNAADALVEIAKPEATSVTKNIKLSTDEDFEIELHQFVFNLDGKKFFKIENVDNNTIYLHSIIIDNSATAIDNALVAPKAVKVIENGQLVIIRDGIRYNTVGQVIE